MNCKPIRNNDQMQCHCGLAWDIGEEKPECANDRRVARQVSSLQQVYDRRNNMMLDKNGNRSIFDDVDE